MGKVKRFPKVIHVTREGEGADGYLNVSDSSTAEGALDSTKTTRVATYELKEVKEGRLEPVFNAIVHE